MKKLSLSLVIFLASLLTVFGQAEVPLLIDPTNLTIITEYSNFVHNASNFFMLNAEDASPSGNDWIWMCDATDFSLKRVQADNLTNFGGATVGSATNLPAGVDPFGANTQGVFNLLVGSEISFRTLVAAGTIDIDTHSGSNSIIISNAAGGGSITLGTNASTGIGIFTNVNGSVMYFNTLNADQFDAGSDSNISIRINVPLTNLHAYGTGTNFGNKYVWGFISVSNIFATNGWITNLWAKHAEVDDANTPNMVVVAEAGGKLTNSPVHRHELLMLTNLATNKSLSNRLFELQPSNTILSELVANGGALTNPLSGHFSTNGATVELSTNAVNWLIRQQLGFQEYIFWDDFNRPDTTNGWLGASSPSGHAFLLQSPDVSTTSTNRGRITNGQAFSEIMTTDDAPTNNRTFYAIAPQMAPSKLGMAWMYDTNVIDRGTNLYSFVSIFSGFSADWTSKGIELLVSNSVAQLYVTTNGAAGNTLIAQIAYTDPLTNTQFDILTLDFHGNDFVTIGAHGTNLLVHHPDIDLARGQYVYYSWGAGYSNVADQVYIESIWAGNTGMRFFDVTNDFAISQNTSATTRAELTIPRLVTTPQLISNKTLKATPIDTDTILLGDSGTTDHELKKTTVAGLSAAVSDLYIVRRDGVGTNTTIVSNLTVVGVFEINDTNALNPGAAILYETNGTYFVRMVTVDDLYTNINWVLPTNAAAGYMLLHTNGSDTNITTSILPVRKIPTSSNRWVRVMWETDDFIADTNYATYLVEDEGDTVLVSLPDPTDWNDGDGIKDTIAIDIHPMGTTIISVTNTSAGIVERTSYPQAPVTNYHLLSSNSVRCIASQDDWIIVEYDIPQPAGGGTIDGGGLANYAAVWLDADTIVTNDSFYFVSNVPTFSNSVGRIDIVDQNAKTNQITSVNIGTITPDSFRLIASNDVKWVLSINGNLSPDNAGTTLGGTDTGEQIAAAYLRAIQWYPTNNIAATEGSMVITTNAVGASALMTYRVSNVVYYVVAATNAPADNQVPTWDATKGFFVMEAPPGAAGGEVNYAESWYTNATTTFGIHVGKTDETNRLVTLKEGSNVTIDNEGTNLVINSTAGPDGVGVKDIYDPDGSLVTQESNLWFVAGSGMTVTIANSVNSNLVTVALTNASDGIRAALNDEEGTSGGVVFGTGATISSAHLVAATIHSASLLSNVTSWAVLNASNIANADITTLRATVSNNVVYGTGAATPAVYSGAPSNEYWIDCMYDERTITMTNGVFFKEITNAPASGVTYITYTLTNSTASAFALSFDSSLIQWAYSSTTNIAANKTAQVTLKYPVFGGIAYSYIVEQ
jgi:hypothetical protein